MASEWLYEVYPGFKHSFTVFTTANGKYYVTEKNKEGLLWYILTDSFGFTTSYCNLKGNGRLPDSIRFRSKGHDGSTLPRTAGILHREW